MLWLLSTSRSSLDRSHAVVLLTSACNTSASCEDLMLRDRWSTASCENLGHEGSGRDRSNRNYKKDVRAPALRPLPGRRRNYGDHCANCANKAFLLKQPEDIATKPFDGYAPEVNLLYSAVCVYVFIPAITCTSLGVCVCVCVCVRPVPV